MLYCKSFSITFNHKKINIHALLPVLPEGFLNVAAGGGGAKISFSANKKYFNMGCESKYGEEENTGPFSLFQTWL